MLIPCCMHIVYSEVKVDATVFDPTHFDPKKYRKLLRNYNEPCRHRLGQIHGGLLVAEFLFGWTGVQTHWTR